MQNLLSENSKRGFQSVPVSSTIRGIELFDLLVWVYRDQRADILMGPGSAGGPTGCRSMLGGSGVGNHHLAARYLPDDAFAVHDFVQRRGLEASGIVEWARRAEKPPKDKRPAISPALGMTARGKIAVASICGRYTPVRIDDGARARQEWQTWHDTCMAVWRAASSGDLVLVRHRIVSFEV